MKRIGTLLIVLLFVAFMTNMASAQLVGKGLKFGASLANLSGSDAGDTQIRTGFGGGAFITYAINDNFAIQPELLYVMKGAKQTYTDPILGDVDGVLKFDYLELPILVQALIPTSGNFKPTVFAGPSVGFLLSAKAKAEAMGYSAEVDVKDMTKSVDFGLAFGAGVGYQLTNGGTITFDARYGLGLTSVDDSGADANIKNGVISIMAGYSFK